MNFKFKSVLVALALLAVGSANADTYITGTINAMDISPVENNGMVRVSINDSTAICPAAGGPLAILRMGAHMGSSPAADKTYSNMYSLLLAAKLANKSVTAKVDNGCSLLGLTLSN